MSLCKQRGTLNHCRLSESGEKERKREGEIMRGERVDSQVTQMQERTSSCTMFYVEGEGDSQRILNILRESSRLFREADARDAD